VKHAEVEFDAIADLKDDSTQSHDPQPEVGTERGNDSIVSQLTIAHVIDDLYRITGFSRLFIEAQVGVENTETSDQGKGSEVVKINENETGSSATPVVGVNRPFGSEDSPGFHSAETGEGENGSANVIPRNRASQVIRYPNTTPAVRVPHLPDDGLSAHGYFFREDILLTCCLHSGLTFTASSSVRSC
jgi:hypothetical protein